MWSKTSLMPPEVFGAVSSPRGTVSYIYGTFSFINKSMRSPFASMLRALLLGVVVRQQYFNRSEPCTRCDIGLGALLC